METPPKQKSFWMLPFTVTATRGLLRDRRMRRQAMLASVIVAAVLAISGATILRPWLNPHEHTGRFIFFWFACAWVTTLALLLALLDLLIVRIETREARKVLQQKIASDFRNEESR